MITTTSTSTTVHRRSLMLMMICCWILALGFLIKSADLSSLDPDAGRTSPWTASSTTTKMEISPKHLFYSLQSLEQAALNNNNELGDNTEAQFELGFVYANGLGVPRDEAKSLLHLVFSATAGNGKSQLALAYRYFHGYNVPKLCPSAAHYYSLAAKNVTIEYEKGHISPLAIETIRVDDDTQMKHKQDESDIVEYLQYAAQRGDAHAKLTLGFSYLHGLRGVSPDKQLARYYFQKAAALGDPQAYNALGLMYAQGNGVPQSNDTALDFFHKGVAAGDSNAHTGIGLMYLNGAGGLPVDYLAAVRHFNIAAAETGNSDALFHLGMMFYDGLGMKKSHESAFVMISRASAQGHIPASYQLGTMYLDGHGVPKNCPLAVKLFKSVAEKSVWAVQLKKAHSHYVKGEFAAALATYMRLAEQGYEVAQSNAAYMLDSNLGVDELKEDMNKVNALPEFDRFERALHLYTRSSHQGNIDSFVRVGDYHFYGRGTNVSFEESLRNYRAAANWRNTRAMFNLGYMHENGQGLPQDFHLAKRYYDSVVEADETAFMPILLSLGKMYSRWGWNILLGWMGLSSPPGTSALEPLGSTEDTLKIADYMDLDRQQYVASHQQDPLKKRQEQEQAQKKEGEDEEEDSGLTSEDLTFTVLVGLFGCLFLVRVFMQRRRNQQRQPPPPPHPPQPQIPERRQDGGNVL